jgi:hypothetical protein
MLPHARAQAGGRYRDQAARCASAFAERLSEAPIALPQMAAHLHLLMLGHPRQVRQLRPFTFIGLHSVCIPCVLAWDGSHFYCSMSRPKWPLSMCWRATQVIIAGRFGATDTEALLDAAFASFTPGAHCLPSSPGPPFSCAQ